MSSISRRRSRLDQSVKDEFLRLFVAGVPAKSAADLVGVHCNTAVLFYHKIRLIIAENLAVEEQEILGGAIEVDESYFGGVRKGKRGRGAAGKTAVFGLLKREGKVYVAVVKDVKAETLLPIIHRKVEPDSIVYSDKFRSYNALDIADFKHERINHSTHFGEGKNHINGIENFWNQAKRRLRKYNGVPADNFELFIKECQFLFNYRPIKNQLKTLQNWTQEKL